MGEKPNGITTFKAKTRGTEPSAEYLQSKSWNLRGESGEILIQIGQHTYKQIHMF